MSKPIKMTEAMIKETLADVEKKLRGLSLVDGKSTVDVNYYYPGKDKAKVTFTPLAWKKQNRLVHEFSTEVGWHGICKRDPEDPAHFIVEDIIIFPQIVTGATVTPSQQEYDLWCASLNDEQFNNCRFHGHSHVYMGVTPSGTDTTFQKQQSGRIEGDGFTEEAKQEIIKQLGDTAFYVFMIINKRGEMWTKIRDLAYNIEYENKEIEIIHDTPADELADFMKDAKEKVKTSSYNTQNKTTNYPRTVTPTYQGGYDYGKNKGATNPPSTTKQQDKKQTTPANNDLPTQMSMDDMDHKDYPFGYWNGYSWDDQYAM